jgi:hypothetical protein
MKRFTAIVMTAALLINAPTAFAIGAIAVDDEVGDSDPGYGVVTGHDSEREAKAAAMKACKEHGNKCEVVGWFKTCGAYASSKNNSGYGFGATKAAATAKAKEVCGDNNCKIIVSECE